MRQLVVYVFLLVFCVVQASAHDVSGAVEVLLKGEKKKEDLSLVVVYLDHLKEIQPASAAVPKGDFSMETRNKQFSPRVLAVPLGAVVNFPNFDPIFHNIFSVSRPNDFDLGLYKGGSSKSRSFGAPGVVRVYCNVHPQMSATIVVANSPHYAIAGKSGGFNLGRVPNGTYLLRALADEGQTEQKIDVGDIPLKVKLIIDGRSFKKIKHKNKLGKDYATDENERY